MILPQISTTLPLSSAVMSRGSWQDASALVEVVSEVPDAAVGSCAACGASVGYGVSVG
jgi:hypothetical protein